VRKAASGLPSPSAAAPSSPGSSPVPTRNSACSLFLLFFFLMEEVKSSVYLAKKNPWNSSWPFLKYNKGAGLLTMGRAALACWRSSSTSAWGGEDAPESTCEAAPSSPGKDPIPRPGFSLELGARSGGPAFSKRIQPLSPPCMETWGNCGVL